MARSKHSSHISTGGKPIKKPKVVKATVARVIVHVEKVHNEKMDPVIEKNLMGSVIENSI